MRTIYSNWLLKFSLLIGPSKITDSFSTSLLWWGLSASSVTFMKRNLMTGFTSLFEVVHSEVSTIFIPISSHYFSPAYGSWMHIAFIHCTTETQSKKIYIYISIQFKKEVQLCFMLRKTGNLKQELSSFLLEYRCWCYMPKACVCACLQLWTFTRWCFQVGRVSTRDFNIASVIAPEPHLQKTAKGKSHSQKHNCFLIQSTYID